MVINFACCFVILFSYRLSAYYEQTVACFITKLLRVLSLVDRCVQMRVRKHGCDVSDSRIFLRNIL